MAGGLPPAWADDDRVKDQPKAETRKAEAQSPFGRKLFSRPPSEAAAKLERDLSAARDAFKAVPDDPDKLIWVGRRLGYLWRMREAIDVYTKGIERWPDNGALYRHRGHRYISVREYGKAIEDLQKASELIRGKPDVVEQDGMPNKLNIPLTTLKFNVYYHLGVAYYLTSQFNESILAFRQAISAGRRKPDNLVACLDWMWMAHQSLGESFQAEQLTKIVSADMEIIENHAYHKRMLLYKGELKPEQVLNVSDLDELQTVTTGYGVAKWYLIQGETEMAATILRKLIGHEYWPAFGVLAAEAEWESRRTTLGEP
jgi:tetratricopeptide (TPR) repeat protein